MNDALPVSGDPASPEGPPRPRLMIFDVNQTLSDMGVKGHRDFPLYGQVVSLVADS